MYLNSCLPNIEMGRVSKDSTFSTYTSTCALTWVSPPTLLK